MIRFHADMIRTKGLPIPNGKWWYSWPKTIIDNMELYNKMENEIEMPFSTFSSSDSNSPKLCP